MDQRCPKICYQKKEDGLTVTACYGIDGQIYRKRQILERMVF